MSVRLAGGLAALALVAALGACSKPAVEEAAPAAPAAPAGPVGAVLTTAKEIAAADIAARVKELADDKYEGRGPGTVAGEASAQWIADEMKRAGLSPGNGDSWFQTVEMVAQTTDRTSSKLTVAGGTGDAVELSVGKDAVFNTPRQDVDTVSVDGSDMVFVGYGVNAPEAKWNDYAGIDAKGKTVVMFVNDPGFITNDASLFKGKAMTYYGRWTYKFEEAGRQGAAAVILIHEDKPAAYGWDVVEGSWSGEQANLVLTDAGKSLATVQGWVTLPTATKLFEKAGLDIDKMRAAANKRGFKAVPMTGLKLSAAIKQTVAKKDSRNVVGTLKGATHPDEHVLYVAHWDHLGKSEPGADGEDVINNGAVDNATGVAMILDIAEKFASEPPQPRSVTFMAVTLEESGLLGSAYFADKPFIPLNKIVGGINIDAMNPMGKTKDVVVVGAGASELENVLKDVLDTQGRKAVPDPHPEAGSFYRSDHISLSKKGVPMLYVDGGVDAVDGGVAKGEAVSEEYVAHAYHSPKDEYKDDWDFSGLQQEAETDYEVGRRMASENFWPNWYKGNEFRALRDEMMKAK